MLPKGFQFAIRIAVLSRINLIFYAKKIKFATKYDSTVESRFWNSKLVRRREKKKKRKKKREAASLVRRNLGGESPRGPAE